MSCRPICCAAALLLWPGLAAADTRLVHHQGRWDPAKHAEIQNRFKATLRSARMDYAVTMQCGPFAAEGWAIVAPLIVTNPTNRQLHCQYYLAFFDDEGRLVGCCGQGNAVKPGAKDQFGSCIVFGPKARLLTATRYQAIVYESDGLIGAEPVSAKDTAGLPGKQRSVITKLKQTGSEVAAKDDFTELRLAADCSFHEPEKGTRNTHLTIKSKAEYEVYLSATEHERLLTRPGKGVEKLPPLWTMTAEMERRQAPQGLASRRHFALLDEKGQLIACVQGPFREMDVPKDRLLAVRKLLVVVYESPLRKER